MLESHSISGSDPMTDTGISDHDLGIITSLWCSGAFDSMLLGLLGSVRAVAVQPILGFQLGTMFGYAPRLRSTKGIACLVVPIKS